MDKTQVEELYLNVSKHSNYQILPNKYLEFFQIPNNAITISRFERERLNYIKSKIDFTGKSVLDIGGNTGFFTFEVLDLGSSSVLHIEGNKEHSDLVNAMATLTNSNVKSINKYFDFTDDNETECYDIVINLNVIHHLGDDFGDKLVTKQDALHQMTQTFDYLYGRCNIMVFQMGYCWKGDRNELLFANGSKAEMIQFVKQSIGDKWEIISIGVAQNNNGITEYFNLSPDNIQRDDSLGEFRNRPIFIIKSK